MAAHLLGNLYPRALPELFRSHRPVVSESARAQRLRSNPIRTAFSSDRTPRAHLVRRRGNVSCDKERPRGAIGQPFLFENTREIRTRRHFSDLQILFKAHQVVAPNRSYTARRCRRPAEKTAT